MGGLTIHSSRTRFAGRLNSGVRHVDEDLRQLIELSIKHESGNPLWPDGFRPFCAKHGVDKDRFCYLFAKVVADEFVNGEMSYSDGDVAMNQLAGIMDID